MAITILKIPIMEAKHTTDTAYRKLSQSARDVLEVMAAFYRQGHKELFDLDDIRGNAELGWREIADCFYELESRQFGRVESAGPDIRFVAFVPVLQSVGLNESFEIIDEEYYD